MLGRAVAPFGLATLVDSARDEQAPDATKSAKFQGNKRNRESISGSIARLASCGNSKYVHFVISNLTPSIVVGTGAWMLPRLPNVAYHTSGIVAHQRWAVVASGRFLTLMELRTGQVAAALTLPGSVSKGGLCVAETEPRLFCGFHDRVMGWELPTFRLILDVPTNEVMRLACDATGSMLGIVEQKKCYWLEVDSGASHALKAAAKPKAIYISRDGSRVLTMSDGGIARLFDPHKSKPLQEFNNFSAPERVLRCGDELLFSHGGLLEMRDAATFERKWHQGYGGGNSAVGAAASGKSVLFVAGTLFATDAGTGAALTGQPPPAFQAPMPANYREKLLAIASCPSTEAVLAVDGHRLRCVTDTLEDQLPPHQPHDGAVAGLFAEGSELWSLGARSLCHWSLKTGPSGKVLRQESVTPIGTRFDSCTSVGMSRTLLAGQGQETLIVELARPEAPPIVEETWGRNRRYVILPHPTETCLIRAGLGNFLEKLGPDGAVLAGVEIGATHLEAAAFLNSELLVGGGEKHVHLVELASWFDANAAPSLVSGRELDSGPSERLGALATSEDGHVAVVGTSGSVAMWQPQLDRWKQLQKVNGSADYYRCALSPCGRRLAASSRVYKDGVDLWDTDQGTLLGTWHEQSDVDASLAFIGTTLVIGTVRGRLLAFES